MPNDDRYPKAEAERRRDEVIKRMLNTPPQPRQQKPGAAEPKTRPAQRVASIGLSLALRLASPALRPAISGLPRGSPVNWLIGQALAGNAEHRFTGALGVVNAQRGALVVPKIELAEITLQVASADMMGRCR